MKMNETELLQYAGDNGDNKHFEISGLILLNSKQRNDKISEQTKLRQWSSRPISDPLYWPV